MSKVSFPTLGMSANYRTTLNGYLDVLEEHLNNYVLYRDNPSGEPNQMENAIDMNGYDILSVNNIDVQNMSIGGLDLAAAIFTASEALAAQVQDIADSVQTNTDDSAASAAASATSASEAATSATEAEASANDAQASLDYIDTVWLGQQDSAPTSGATVGSLYYNTTDDIVYLCYEVISGVPSWRPLAVDDMTLGTASYVDTGTAAGEVPLNSDLAETAHTGRYVGAQYQSAFLVGATALSDFSGFEAKGLSYYKTFSGANGGHIIAAGSTGTINVYSLSEAYNPLTINATALSSQDIGSDLGGESIVDIAVATYLAGVHLYVLTSGYRVLRFTGSAGTSPSFSLDETVTLSATFTPSGAAKSLFYNPSNQRMYITGASEIIQATITGTGGDQYSIDGAYGSKQSLSISGINSTCFTTDTTSFSAVVGGELRLYLMPGTLTGSVHDGVTAGSALGTNFIVDPDKFIPAFLLPAGNTLYSYETTRILYFNEP